MGTATGRIIIDVSSLESAQAVAQSVAASISAAMQQINAAQNVGVGSNGIAAAVQAQAQVVQAAGDAWIEMDVELIASEDDLSSAVQASVATVQTAADAKVAAVSDETQALIGFYEDQTAAANDAADAQAAASGGGGGGGGFSGGAGRGLARSFFSVGVAARAVGLSQLSQPAFAIGGLTQVVAEIPVFNNQIAQMATQLTNMNGVFGQLANVGASAAAALGAESGGVVASLLAVGAVALPIVAVFGVLALVLGQAAQQAQAAADALKAEADINAQIAGGATSADLQKQIDDKTNQQKGYLNTISQVQGLLNATDIPTRKPLTDLTGIDPTSANGVQDILLALGGLQKQADALTPTIAQLKLALNSAGVAANDLAAANNATAAAAVSEAQFKQQLVGQSVDQLQQEIAANRALADSLQQQGALLTGDAYTKAAAQIKDLDQQFTDLTNALNNANLQQTVQGVLALNNAYAQIQETASRTSVDRQIQATDTSLDRLTTTTRALQDAALQASQAQADFALQQARAQQDFNNSRILEQRDYDQQTLQDEQDQQAKLAQIMSDSRLSILQDAQHLDALAVYNDEQKRNQQIADDQANYTQQETQRAAAYAQQLSDQQTQFDLQEQRQQQDFSLSNSRTAAQFQLQQTRQAEDWSTQNQRQQAQYQLQDLRTAQDNANQLATLAAHYNLMDFTQNYWLTRLQNGWSAFFQGLPMPPQIQPISGQYTSSASTYGVNTSRPLVQTGDIHIHGDFSGTDDAGKVAIVEQGLRAFFGQALSGAR